MNVHEISLTKIILTLVLNLQSESRNSKPETF